MRIRRSRILQRFKSQPSRPATMEAVPTQAVRIAQAVAAMLAVLSTPMSSTGLSRKKKGMTKPMMPRRTAQMPVLFWSEPAMPAAT